MPSKKDMPPVMKPDWGINSEAGRDKSYKQDVKATWLGHACYLLEFPCAEGDERGLRIIFDP